MNVVRSKNHDIYSMTMNKIALSANEIGYIHWLLDNINIRNKIIK